MAQADSEQAKEKISLQNTLAETDRLMSSRQAKYVQQLIPALALPPKGQDMESRVYEEEHWSIGALEQDEFTVSNKTVQVLVTFTKIVLLC